MKKQSLTLCELVYGHSFGYKARTIKPLYDEIHAQLSLDIIQHESPYRYYWVQTGKVTAKQLAEHVALADKLEKSTI
jgi:hypothetical protein